MQLPSNWSLIHLIKISFYDTLLSLGVLQWKSYVIFSTLILVILLYGVKLYNPLDIIEKATNSMRPRRVLLVAKMYLQASYHWRQITSYCYKKSSAVKSYEVLNG